MDKLTRVHCTSSDFPQVMRNGKSINYHRLVEGGNRVQKTGVIGVFIEIEFFAEKATSVYDLP